MFSLLLLACSPSENRVDTTPGPTSPDLSVPTVADPAPPTRDPVAPFPPAAEAVLDALAPDFALESADGVFHLAAHTGDVILLELSGFN